MIIDNGLKRLEASSIVWQVYGEPIPVLPEYALDRMVSELWHKASRLLCESKEPSVMNEGLGVLVVCWRLQYYKGRIEGKAERYRLATIKMMSLLGYTEQDARLLGLMS